MKPQSEPGDVTVEGGWVILDGPDGVALTLTPQAAGETGRRLIAAGFEAVRSTIPEPPSNVVDTSPPVS
nr:hypothetical protein [Sphingomonas gellani]